jgi:hypothetical protein
VKLEPRDASDVGFGAVRVRAFEGTRTFARAGTTSTSFPDAVTLALTRPATEVTTVTVTSSDEAIARVAALTFAAGEQRKALQVEALGAGTVTLTASGGEAQATTTLRVLDVEEPARPTSLLPNGARVAAESATTFTVSLDVPAPASGLQLALQVAPASLGSAPATVQVPANALSATFAFTAGTTPGAGTVTVTAGSQVVTVGLTVVGAAAFSVDLSGFTVVETAGEVRKTFTLPEGTVVPAGGTVVIGRNGDRAAFEAGRSVVLGPDCIYVDANAGFLVINATPKKYSLLDKAGAVVDGPTAPSANTKSMTRNLPLAAVSEPTSWTVGPLEAATPGTRIGTAGDAAGCYFSEVSDARDFNVEMIEISCE